MYRRRFQKDTWLGLPTRHVIIHDMTMTLVTLAARFTQFHLVLRVDSTNNFKIKLCKFNNDLTITLFIQYLL